MTDLKLLLISVQTVLLCGQFTNEEIGQQHENCASEVRVRCHYYLKDLPVLEPATGGHKLIVVPGTQRLMSDQRGHKGPRVRT